MTGVVSLLCLYGCTWISRGEWLQAADRDGDGYPAIETGGDDCDDADSAVSPGASETCDGRDEDCDGEIDEGIAGEQAWYPDADGDGYGVPGEPVTACAVPEGYGDGQDDCDDSDPAVHPGAPERLDGADQDCDDVTDDLTLPESADWTLWGAQATGRLGESSFARTDLDGDGHADLVAAGGGDAVGLWWGGSLALSGEADTTTWQPDLRIEGSDLRALAGDGALDGEAGTLVLAGDESGDSVCRLFFGAELPASGSVAVGDADVTLLSCGDHDFAKLAWGGDLDGDGVADLPALFEATGSLAVLAGRESAHWNRLDGGDIFEEAELSVDAAALSEPLWVRLEGDLDGDGLADLVVGAPATGGACLVAYGREALLDGATTLTFPTDADAVFAGLYLGAPLTSAADLDDDGRAELLVGSPGEGEVLVFVPGAARWSGSLDPEETAFATWRGSLDLDVGLSAGPDVDGDTLPDVLVGGAGDPDAWLVPGPLSAGRADLDELASAKVAGLQDGHGVSLAWDLDGDGSGELLLADPFVPSQAGGGALYLLYGFR